MDSRMKRLALLSVAGMLAFGLASLVWAMGQGSSQAQDGTMHHCPQSVRSAIAVWEGPDGTNVEQALATCGEDGVLAAYRLSPDGGSWFRWFAGRPELNTLTTLDNLQGVITLGGVGASPPSSVSSSFQQEDMHDCPKPGRWAISVWSGANGTPIEQALATCADVWVSVAYHLDPHTQGWHRWFLAYPELSTLATLDHMQAVLAWAARETPTAQTGGTAVGQYPEYLPGGSQEWPVVSQNTMTLKFNSGGGPIISGEGRLGVRGAKPEHCEPVRWFTTLSYKGTYDAETKTFSGTFQVESRGFEDVWVCTDDECICELLEPYHLSDEDSWQATLTDGVVTGGAGAYRFELTVQS